MRAPAGRHSRSRSAAPGAGLRPLAPGLIAVAAAVAVVVARWSTWAQHNIANFILVGRHFAIPSQVPAGIPLQPTYGYDGQYYYRLALDPANLAHTAFGIRVDHSYRFMRIGYPALTWLLSAGHHALVPDVLVAVNVLCVGALGYFGGMFAIQGGRSALWGLLPAGYFGLVTSLSRDTAEPLGAACLLGGLVALRARRPVLAGLVLAYGALTRETVMVAVGAIGITRIAGMVRGRHGIDRTELAWVIPGVVFAAWQATLYAVTGSLALATDGGRNAGLPFVAPLRAVAYNVRHMTGDLSGRYDLWVFELIALVFVAVAAIATMRHSRAPGHEKLMLFGYILEICLVNPNTWGSVNAAMRSFIEVYLVAVIILLSVPARRLGARFGWVFPVLGAWMIPVAVGVTHRGMTIPFRTGAVQAGPFRAGYPRRAST